MPKFKVHVSYTLDGILEIEADSFEDAEERAWDIPLEEISNVAYADDSFGVWEIENLDTGEVTLNG